MNRRRKMSDMLIDNMVMMYLYFGALMGVWIVFKVLFLTDQIKTETEYEEKTKKEIVFLVESLHCQPPEIKALTILLLLIAIPFITSIGWPLMIIQVLKF
jgi:hypothetical protein